MLATDLAATARGGTPDPATFVQVPGQHWWHALLVPLPILLLAGLVVGAGRLITVLALRLLGPSPPSAWPRWRAVPNSFWNGPASPASCTTPSDMP